jgi:hypothetical protein
MAQRLRLRWWGGPAAQMQDPMGSLRQSVKNEWPVLLISKATLARSPFSYNGRAINVVVPAGPYDPKSGGSHVTLINSYFRGPEGEGYYLISDSNLKQPVLISEEDLEDAIYSQDSYVYGFMK